MVQTVETTRLSERVARLKERLLSATPRVDVEKIKFQFEVYRQNEGQPSIIRRAKLFDKLCADKTIFIDDNPLAGTLSRFEYGSYPIPEVASRWYLRSETFHLQRGKAAVSQEDREWINKMADFWKDANVFTRTREIGIQTLGVDVGLLQKCGCGTELTPGGLANMTPDFDKVLKRGFNGIIADIKEAQSKMDPGAPDGKDRYYFYAAATMCLEGMIKLANRYAALARDMAKSETDSQKKRDLLRMAAACEHVPAKPARSFFEALQSVWLTTLGVWMEAPFVLNCPPSRFPQYMYPLYKKDKEAGKITPEEAVELIQCYFLKINSLAQVLPPHGFAWSQSRLGQHLCIGGQTPNGDDATNEVDWLVLEAQLQLRMPEPLVDLLYHPQLSEDFLLKCVELIKTGIGQPAMHNMQKAMVSHLHHDGMPITEARNLSIVGCVQTQVPGSSSVPWEGAFNTAKMVELALNNGADPLTGNRLGPQTGDPETFRTYDEFYAAFLKQVKYFVPLQRKLNRTAWNVARDYPVPLASALTNDCVTLGKDAMDGGCRYHQANGTTFVAAIDTTNSLAAIKKLVYEDRRLSIKQLKQALAANWEGYEELHHMCLNAPKYGNDDPYVDSIARQIYDTVYEEHRKAGPDFLGKPAKPEAYSVTVHFATGRFTGALPSGRKARLPLTDASVSATPGTDKNGPTALVKSAAKAIDTDKYGANHLNMKFHPTALTGVGGSRKLLSLIKTYFDLGGFHVQFNCVTSKTLREAQLYPDKYRDLVVRVAGFSAFFIYLDKLVQDEIIKRTELSFR